MVPQKKQLCQTAFLFCFLGLSLALPLKAETRRISKRGPAEEEPAAKVVSINGRVRSGERWLKPGDALVVGDVVRAEEESGAKLLLADKSVIDVSASSSLRIESFVPNSGADREVMLSVEKGKVRASIKKKLEGRGKFLLRTPASVLAVRGTELLIDVSGSGSQSTESVVVKEGNVVAELAGGGGKVTILEGRRLDSRASRSGDTWSVRPTDSRVSVVGGSEMSGAFSRGTVVDRSFLQGVEIRENSALFKGRETVQTLAVNFNAPPPLSPQWRADPGQVLKDQTPVKPDNASGLRRTGADQAIDVGGANVSAVDVSVIFKP